MIESIFIVHIGRVPFGHNRQSTRCWPISYDLVLSSGTLFTATWSSCCKHSQSTRRRLAFGSETEQLFIETAASSLFGESDKGRVRFILARRAKAAHLVCVVDRHTDARSLLSAIKQGAGLYQSTTHGHKPTKSASCSAKHQTNTL